MEVPIVLARPAYTVRGGTVIPYRLDRRTCGKFEDGYKISVVVDIVDID